ncbi:N-formylglutamate amidohydrolase [Roseovarius sp. LXJ103]|uniref:N-formylglutamate amidohydrolase n=1 Tax=Roseovarius carneus TaxID=2853164 RepID=UPI000D608157|nr:N-formylglutamate amidohydrolase [Roseovarius carneus]MBZ8118319.1 N-formylglutamate amidohydrolase [Roseovarius carneus]PWE37297.1 N-formylglutamate amidohydrolase [Pelagicola sp. LXJ1103]
MVGDAMSGPALVLCEHASNHIPPEYDGLGLAVEAAQSHAAWDPGARALAVHIARALRAPMIAGAVSRLVYDCNRPPEAQSAMPARSEVIDIPGNANLSAKQRAARTEAIYRPFIDAVGGLLDRRRANAVPTALITVHSFTPVYHGVERSTEIGLLHDSDATLTDAMLRCTLKLPHRQIDRNQPYGPEDGVTHSLQIHGIARDLPNVMIEVRNDLLQSEAQIAQIGGELLTLLRPALIHLGLMMQGRAHG